MGHSRLWTTFEAKPDGADQISAGDDEIRSTKIDIRERMVVDHVWNSTTATDGRHTAVTLLGAGTAASSLAGYIVLYAQTAAAGVIELYVTGTGTEVTQLTKRGFVNLDDGRLSNTTWLIGANSGTSANINIIRVNTANLLETGTDFGCSILVNTTAVTNNNYLIPRGGLAVVVDGTTITATTGASVQIKVGTLFGAMVDYSAAGAHDNELAATDGLVDAFCTAGADGHVMMDGYTDAASPPTTQWKRCTADHDATSLGVGGSFTMRVRKGERWLVNTLDSGTVNWKVYWTPIGN